MADRAELLRQFCDVTGASEDRSKFFLDSSNWQLEVALSSFYENAENEPIPVPVEAPVISSDDSPPPSPLRPNKDKKEKNKRNENQKFATLSSIQNDSSSDEEEGQAFYAGGSERSGQQILGPNKNRADFVAEMFKSVRERGAVAADDDEPMGRQSAAFSGTGYRLGHTEDDHSVVAPPSSRSESVEPRSVRLQLYREGFTVDSGSLRQYSDPDNAAFLEYIRRGEIPPELAASSGEVRVSLEDKRHESCPVVASRAPAFTGKGHVLGRSIHYEKWREYRSEFPKFTYIRGLSQNPTPPTVGATALVAADVSDRAANERIARTALGLNEAQPTTNIQIRLADGTRLVATFNHTHQVQNIRDYITTAVPSYQLRNFALMTTFPSAELEDPTATIADAKLLNSVVVQRLL